MVIEEHLKGLSYRAKARVHRGFMGYCCMCLSIGWLVHMSPSEWLG